MTTVPLWIIVIVLLAPFVGLLLLIERVLFFLDRRGTNREAEQSVTNREADQFVGNGVRMMVAALTVVVLLVLGTGVVKAIELARFLFGGGLSFTKSVEVTAPGQDRGYYYRFKASYAYK